MRKVVKGAGMTAEKITVYDTPEEISAALLDQAVHAAGRDIFESRIGAIEAWAREQLAALGIKDVDAIRTGDPRFMGDSLRERVGNYAVKVLTYIHYTRHAIERRNAPAAAHFAVDIGELFARIQIAIEWEKFALRGKQMGKNLDTDRAKGVAKRQKASQEKLAPIKKVVEDLRGNIATADMTAEQMRDHILDPRRKISLYSPKSTLKHIKTFAAQIKKKH
jgi:hypothetical protein